MKRILFLSLIALAGCATSPKQEQLDRIEKNQMEQSTKLSEISDKLDAVSDTQDRMMEDMQEVQDGTGIEPLPLFAPAPEIKSQDLKVDDKKEEQKKDEKKEEKKDESTAVKAEDALALPLEESTPAK